ncbi:MAG TPA: PKD domain-containing protein, partial [Bacteroidia bacterium]|nr:PKD domain-containing protein [Bacteroidia bacterium]
MRTIGKHIPLMFCAALVLVSCRKDDPVEPATTPVFFANGTMNANNFSYSAGVNDYYMYSSFSNDANNVYDFEGDLRKTNSSASSPLNLAVHIRDYRQHSTSATNVDSALAAGFYNFRNPVSNSIDFTSLASGDSSMTWLWDFGDGNFSTLVNPTHTYNTAGNYEVCLTIGSSLFGPNSLCDSITVGTTPVVNVDFTNTLLNANDSVQFTAVVNGGTTPYSYNWAFGDGNTSVLSSVIHQYPSNDSVYQISLSVGDANAYWGFHRKNMAMPGYVGSVANFSWTPNNSAAGPDPSMVTVEWTDAAGNLFTSADPRQPVTSTFQVLSVENYATNENGQQTKKVHMRINC